MFSKKLSTALLGICESQNLSYESASEICGLSSRYFGSIARGQASPSVNTLEKLCDGFDRSPNDLLGFSTSDKELSYRISAQVVHIRYSAAIDHHFLVFPVCPACSSNIEREYQSFCSVCGQKLQWDFYQHATLINPK